jgi:ubiquinone/menaquinone biosynthesis C-methylase UbiE
VSYYHGADDPERRRWQDPERILGEIGLKPGLVFMDIGCGGGFFTLPAARLVGAVGRVYGVDSNPRVINDLRARAVSEGLANVELVEARAEDTVLCRACADIVFFGIVLHDFEDASQVLKNARTILKPSGKLVNLDWDKNAPVGPPPHIRFDKAKASRLIEAAGFVIESVEDSGPYHYLITARMK